MIVTHFNTFPYGGAATAAKRLHRQLNAFGTDVASRFCYHRDEKGLELDPSFYRAEFDDAEPASFWAPIARRMEKNRKRRVHRQYDMYLAGHDSGGEVFSMAELPDRTRLKWVDTDILHLHWVSFFIDYPSFFASIPDGVPIVWTLHDMNAFTGGCHYSSGCTRFKSGCGSCGQIRNPGDSDLSRHTFKSKQKALRNKDIHVVTPSRWMGDLAQQSPIWPENTSFHVINLGFNLQQFEPVKKAKARSSLGIDQGPVLVAFGAEDIRNRRKGFHHLLASLKRLDEKQNVECLVFGSGEIEPDPDLPKIHRLGYINSTEKQKLVYSAADIVVVPSREDNQPQIGLEAMACGTPVVAFDAGGIAEYVRHGVTGHLAELGNEQDLAKKISALVADPQARIALGNRARLVMEHEFELQTQSARYLELYESILFMKQYRNKIA